MTFQEKNSLPSSWRMAGYLNKKRRKNSWRIWNTRRNWMSFWLLLHPTNILVWDWSWFLWLIYFGKPTFQSRRWAWVRVKFNLWLMVYWKLNIWIIIFKSWSIWISQKWDWNLRSVNRKLIKSSRSFWKSLVWQLCLWSNNISKIPIQRMSRLLEDTSGGWASRTFQMMSSRTTRTKWSFLMGIRRETFDSIFFN